MAWIHFAAHVAKQLRVHVDVNEYRVRLFSNAV